LFWHHLRRAIHPDSARGIVKEESNGAKAEETFMKRSRGIVQGGVVVLDEPVDLPEGTHVLVQVSEPDWLEAIDGGWKDDQGIEQWLRERMTSRAMSEGSEI
jgi:hypothetical protein